MNNKIISNELVNAITSFYSNFTPVLTGHRTKIYDIHFVMDFYIDEKPVIFVEYKGNDKIEWDIPDDQINDYENSLEDVYTYNVETKQFELEKK